MAEAAALVVCEHDNVVTECWRCRDVFEVMEALKKKKKESECEHHHVVRLSCGCEQNKKTGGIRVGNKLYKREDIVWIELTGELKRTITVTLRHALGTQSSYHETNVLAEAEMKRIQSEM